MSNITKTMRQSQCKENAGCSPPACLCGLLDDAADRIEELEAALRYLVSECDEDMDDDYNPHYAPLAQARAALADTEKPE